MTKYTLALPNFYTLKLSFGKRRKKAHEKTFLAEIKTLGDIRTGNRLSRAVRIFAQKANIKALLGGNLAFLFLTTSLLDPTSASLSSNELAYAQIEAEARILVPVQTQLTTEVVTRYPVDKPVLNQGYAFYHQALDIDGASGDPVYPIQNGTVDSLEFSRYGYGNAVIVTHKNGLKSRYAHLRKITVKDQEEVTTKTKIGEVGSTGHSTGPHVHLEIEKEGKRINPQAILGPITK